MANYIKEFMHSIRTSSGICFITLALSFLALQTCPAQSSEIRTNILRKSSLDFFKDAYVHGEKKSKKIISDFLAEADGLLKSAPHSVMEKSIIPPSGDKHDFMSMGPYWWPDPSKKDGLPYIRRDGERNPEYYQIPDQEYFSTLMYNTQTLTVAFYITGDSTYAIKAVELIKVWFLNDETKMNPNMQHAQYIPGINTGRGIGLIETSGIFRVLDAVQILRSSALWKNEDDKKFVNWMESYFTWITTHPYGIDESKEKNNHGTWYDVQAGSLALFLGKTDFAKKLFEDAKAKRIGAQIEPNGEQPLELARTKSWSYCNMNLTAFIHLALLAETVNVDLWNYQSERGGSIRKAVNFLLPFAAGTDKWKHQQIAEFHTDSILHSLILAAKKYDGKFYNNWMEEIFHGKAPITLINLLN